MSVCLRSGSSCCCLCGSCHEIHSYSAIHRHRCDSDQLVVCTNVVYQQPLIKFCKETKIFGNHSNEGNFSSTFHWKHFRTDNGKLNNQLHLRTHFGDCIRFVVTWTTFCDLGRAVSLNSIIFKLLTISLYWIKDAIRSKEFSDFLFNNLSNNVNLVTLVNLKESLNTKFKYKLSNFNNIYKKNPNLWG